VDSFKQDRTIVARQVLQQRAILPASHNKGTTADRPGQCHCPAVVDHTLTILLKLRSDLTGTIQEAMQGNLDTKLMEGYQSVKFVYRSTIVGWKRDMYRDNMQVSHRGKNRPPIEICQL
jgi:hypothetical protein